RVHRHPTAPFLNARGALPPLALARRRPATAPLRHLARAAGAQCALRPDREAGWQPLGGAALDGSFCARFGGHDDGMTRTLFEARGAPGTEVELNPVEPALPELDDRLLGTRRVAVVALETVAAGQAPHRLVPRLAFGETGHDFVESCSLRQRQLG